MTDTNQYMYPEPVSGHLLVEEFPEETITQSGLHIVSLVEKSMTFQGHGTIIAVGPSTTFDDGSIRDSEFRPGEEIYFRNNTGSTITLDGKTYLIIKETSVLVVMRGKAEKEPNRGCKCLGEHLPTSGSIK